MKKEAATHVAEQAFACSTGTSVEILDRHHGFWKRFCLSCLFHTSLFIVGCLLQLVYTKFPNRVLDGRPRPVPRLTSPLKTTMFSLGGVAPPRSSWRNTIT